MRTLSSRRCWPRVPPALPLARPTGCSSTRVSPSATRPRIVPYLAALGVSHLYASPDLPGEPRQHPRLRRGRLQPAQPRDRRRDDFEALVDRPPRARDGADLVDFVPNHMGIAGGANPWWQDVLENGQTSAYAALLRHRLGAAQAGAAAARSCSRSSATTTASCSRTARSSSASSDGAFTLWYYAPAAPDRPADLPARSCAARSTRLAARVRARRPSPPRVPEHRHRVRAPAAAGRAGARAPGRAAARAGRRQAAARAVAGGTPARSPPRSNAAVREINGTPGDPPLLRRARRADRAPSATASPIWRVAAEEINYRRFFAINELAAIRQEEPAVFAATHELLLRLVGEGKIDGRPDRPPGRPLGSRRLLPLPAARRLPRPLPGALLARKPPRGARALGVGQTSNRRSPPGGMGDGPTTGRPRPPRPALPAWSRRSSSTARNCRADWAVDGTVGYEFAQAATGLFVDARRAARPSTSSTPASPATRSVSPTSSTRPRS